MKAFYVPVALLTTILFFSIFTGSYVQRSTQKWIVLLEQCDGFLREEQWERTENLLTRAYEGWQAHSTTFHMLLEHRDLEEAENLFSGAFAACRDRNSEDLTILLHQLNSQQKHKKPTSKISSNHLLLHFSSLSWTAKFGIIFAEG